MFLVWKRIALLFLCIETLLFGLIYSFGPHGLSMLSQLDKSYYELEVRCDDLERAIGDLEVDIQEWAKSDFLKERVARERLLMKKPGEVVYFRK